MNKRVLLVVDVQNGLIYKNPYNKENVIKNIKRIIEESREKGIEVIYVRHDDGEDSDLAKGSYEWDIYSEIYPKKNEKIVEKFYNSAFHKTDLDMYLKNKEVEEIILMGLQTEYCIDATCKSAFDLGYKVIMPEETNTTFSNEYLKGEKLYEYYNFKIWNGRFAEVLTMDKVIDNLKGK